MSFLLYLSDIETVGDDEANLAGRDNIRLGDDEQGSPRSHQVAQKFKTDGQPTVRND